MKRFSALLLIALLPLALVAQAPTNDILRGRGPFTAADTLRGALNHARTTFDVLHYDLHLAFNLVQQSISGHNDITFRWTGTNPEIQIDLFERYTVDNITDAKGKALKWRRFGNALFVTLKPHPGKTERIRIAYHGIPPVARNAPWDGGFVWKKSPDGAPWVGVACEGLGASAWWPMKDHLSDEPDSVSLHYTAPSSLMAIGNGQPRGKTVNTDGTTTWHWAVTYPINSYNVTVNIGNYATLSNSVVYSDGSVLPVRYYPLKVNEARARAHFHKEVPPMMACYEKWVGKYPFFRDGYSLVETHYWGMEHQGAVAYGNGYGTDPQHYDNVWDFIIVHETGHEWFGNNISMADHGDMWIHESFTTYLEMLYEECLNGYESSVKYLLRRRRMILNDDAIQGPSSVNFNNWEGADMYYKGAWMLHTLRNHLKDEARWGTLFLEMNKRFGLKQTNTAEVVDFLGQHFGKNLRPFFNTYLNYSLPPALVLSNVRSTGPDTYEATLHWETPEPDFELNIDLLIGEDRFRRLVTRTPTAFSFKVNPASLRPDPNSSYVRFRDDSSSNK